MNLSFKRATKHAAKLRLAFVGPAGAGKTYSSLSVATSLGGRIAVIDSERGSASKYADIFQFDVLELEAFSPQVYTQAIKAAERASYDTIIIDSLSHAWMGREGALEQKDNYSRRAGENSFTAWRHVTPKHNEMVDAIVGSSCHVIATLRAKTEYSQEKDEKGKTIVRKVGLAPIQRDGLEYEFDVVGDLDIENTFAITKTRCPALTGKLVERPGDQLAQVLKAWLDGVPRPVEEPKPPAAAATAPSNVVPLQQPEAMQELDAAPATDDLEQRLRACASAQEFGALVAEIKRLPEGERRDRLRAVYAELRAARAAAQEPAQGGVA